MVVLADRSIGYHSSIDTVQWGQLARFLGSDYALGAYARVETNDLLVAAVPGADRTVSIKPGTAYGHGIMDVFDNEKQLALPPLAAGTLWYTIVVRRDWRNEQTFLAYEPGQLNAPAAAVSAALNKIPGSVDDQQIALVKIIAGQTQPAEIIQLRQYTSKRGTLSNLMAWADAPIGAEADVDGMVYRMSIMPDGTKNWRFTTPRFWRGKVWDGNNQNGIVWPRNSMIVPPIYAATGRYAKSINMDHPHIVNPYKTFELPPGGYRFTWQAEWDARLVDGYIAAVRIYVQSANEKLDSFNWWLGPTLQDSHPDKWPQFLADGIAPLNAQMANRGTRVRCETYAQIEQGDTVLFATFHDHPTDQLRLRHGENASFVTIQRV